MYDDWYSYGKICITNYHISKNISNIWAANLKTGFVKSKKYAAPYINTWLNNEYDLHQNNGQNLEYLWTQNSHIK